MMHLYSLTVCLVLLPGAAHLSIRIGDSHTHTQEQTNTFTSSLQLSGDAREAFFPCSFGTRLFIRPGPEAGSLPAAYGQETQHGRLVSHRAASPLRIGARRASVALTAASGPAGGSAAIAQGSQDTPTTDEELMAVRAPLRMLGPYPVLSLRFPNIPTPDQFKEQQKSSGERGVSLDFVVDTAANVNTINAKLATDLSLATVGFNEGGISAGGTLAGGATYMLGTAQLNDLPQSDRFDFISNLTASALPVASPSGAGLLGIGFLLSFAGGVEFNWGLAAANDSDRAAVAPVSVGEAGHLPSLTVFGDMRGTGGLTKDLTEVPARQLESGLICVTMRVNNVEIPSLLDTGSPISVLNAAAAKAAGIDIPPPEVAGTNLFAKAKVAMEITAAVASGEALMIGGAGGPVILRRIPQKSSIALGSAQLGSGRPYVGEIPGLAALGGLGADAGPAAVLGTDVLRQRKRLVLQNGKVFV